MKKIYVFFMCVQLTVFCCQNSFGQWVQTSCPAKYPIQCLDTNGTNIFAGSDGGGVYLSTDNGGSWKAVNDGLSDTNIISIAISGSNVFVGTNGGGVFLSSNNGGSWNAVNTRLTNQYIYCLAISRTNIFTGTWGGGVFLTSNNGTNWTAVNNGLPYDSSYSCYYGISSLVISGINIFAGTSGGVFLSTNNGGSWTAVLLTNHYIISLAINGTNIFAGTGGGGLFLSTNNGTSWKAVNNGLTDYDVSSLAINGRNIFAGTSSGVFLSRDNGGSWNTVNDGFIEPNIWSLAISEKNIFASIEIAGAEGQGVWKRSLSDILGVNELGIRNEELGIKIQPNPANQLSVISYQLPLKGFIHLAVYDMIGNEVGMLVNKEQEKGEYTIQFNAENLKSGVYFVRMKRDDGNKFVKFIKL